MSIPPAQSGDEPRGSVVEHPGMELPPALTVIVRYVSVAKLVSLLTREHLYFAPVDKLGDAFEGQMPEPMEAIALASRQSGHITPEQLLVLDRFKLLQRSADISCWHEMTNESDALWRIYAEKEESVAVLSTVGGLCRSIADSGERIDVGRVQYIDFRTYNEPDKVFFPFAFKRTCFAHEREVRAVRMMPFNVAAVTDPSTPPEVFLATGTAVAVDLRQLIDEIVVSPYGSDWLLQAVSELVAQLGIEAPVRFSDLK